jgi:hypothetical protein
MKPPAFLSVLVLLVASMLAYLTVRSGAVEAGAFPQHLGEVCFEAGGEGGPLIRVSATDMGDGHYFVTGRLTDPAIPGYIEPVFGNAEAKGGKIYMTIVSGRAATGTGDDTITSGWIISAVLEAATLTGTVESVGIEHDAETPPGETGVAYSEPVSLRRIACP